MFAVFTNGAKGEDGWTSCAVVWKDAGGNGLARPQGFSMGRNLKFPRSFCKNCCANLHKHRLLGARRRDAIFHIVDTRYGDIIKTGPPPIHESAA
jgi:hypothetical protein